MRGLCRLALIVFLFVLVSVNGELRAEDILSFPQDGRFVLLMVNAGEGKSGVIPAMVLDSYRGVVWTCYNLQDARSSWVRSDLGQSGDKPMTNKKYSAKLVASQDRGSAFAAVLDVEEGTVWTCINIIDSKAIWTKKDFGTIKKEDQKTGKN